MTKERLQLMCAALALINFSNMLLYAWGLQWKSVAVALILAIDVLAACLILRISYRRTLSAHPLDRASNFWLRPQFLLNAVGGYAFVLTVVLLALGHFPRQAIIFLIAGMIFCFLVIKVAEVVESQILEREDT
ncbi:MAG: hypothetical protein ACREPV_06420 [Lysobacter sp.]